MGYTPSFTPQYENGWENLPSETSPITAEAFNAYDDAIENIEEYLASDESQANLADAYDETATYEAGDYVIYGGDLYKCLEDIDEPEEWDSTKWESCLITEEMATSGGTTVIANPSGEATETLTKLQVEETIYGISGGGGNANIWTGTQAELEEVFDELEEGTQINITDDEQEVVEGGTIYSTDEQCIGLWTNKKPLYQKTFTGLSISLGTNSWTTLTGVTITNGEDLVKADCYGEYTEQYVINCTKVHLNKADGSIEVRNTESSTTLTAITLTYTKSTDAPLDIVIGKSTMYIASSDCYSTEEKEVGCAPNGKPLYQKTILHTGTFTGSESLQTIAHGISNFDEAVSINGFIYDAHNENPSWMPLPRFYTSNAFGISHVTTSDIYIYIPSAFGTRLRNARITIQYTKTTDTAGSGSYTPASGKAIHYSTDEQVIGTYVDGKPIYRKSFTYSSGSLSTGSLILANDLSNVERVIDKHCQFHSSFEDRDYDIPYTRLAYNESVFLLCHVLSDNTVATALISGDHSSYNSMTDIVLTLEYTKTTD